MTIAINPVTVADSIAGLSISGVTIKSVGSIPSGGALVCPILFPQPVNFITGIEASRESFGGGSTAKTDFNYTLHYVFLFAELGSGINQLDPYSPLLQKLELIWETIMTNDVVSGLVDIELEGIEALGNVQDPYGNDFWGALFSLRCLEYAQ